MIKGIKKLYQDRRALSGLGQAAIALGLSAIICGITSYVLATIGTMISSANTTVILNYGQQAIMTLAQWLGIIALAIAVAYVISFFRGVAGGAEK